MLSIHPMAANGKPTIQGYSAYSNCFSATGLFHNSSHEKIANSTDWTYVKPKDVGNPKEPIMLTMASPIIVAVELLGVAAFNMKIQNMTKGVNC